MVAMRDSSGAALAARRFAGLEPVGFEAGDNNWYRFVANDPYQFTDPFGLDARVSNQEHSFEYVAEGEKATVNGKKRLDSCGGGNFEVKGEGHFVRLEHVVRHNHLYPPFETTATFRAHETQWLASLKGSYTCNKQGGVSFTVPNAGGTSGSPEAATVATPTVGIPIGGGSAGLTVSGEGSWRVYVEVGINVNQRPDNSTTEVKVWFKAAWVWSWSLTFKPFVGPIEGAYGFGFGGSSVLKETSTPAVIMVLSCKSKDE